MGCKKQEEKVVQTVPGPFYFQLLSSAGAPISPDNVKIWYFNENDDKTYVKNVKPIKMKSGNYDYGIMSQEISFISAFKKINTFYVEANDGVINTLTLKIDDLGYNSQDINRFPVMDVKFNGKEIQYDEHYLPGLWLLNN